MGQKRHYNWPMLRAAYIEGHVDDQGVRDWPTVEELATLHSLSLNVLRHRAGKERWTDQRRDYQTELDRERRRQLIEQRGDRAVRVDDRGLQNAEAGLSLVGMRLTWLLRQQAAVPEVQRGASGVDARELAALGLAGKRFLDLKAHVMGQPPVGTEATIDEIEREARLAEQRIAERLVAFIAEREADAAAETDEAESSVSS